MTQEGGSPWLPLSILTIGSFLKHHGYDPVLLDPQVHPDWKDRLAALTAQGPVYLGVTCMTGPSIYNVLEAIGIAKGVDPTTPVVWGGYHATLRYSGIVREGLADAVTRGPGEDAALELARIFEHRRSGDAELADELRTVSNIAYGPGGGGRTGLRLTPSKRMPDVNDLPPCDYTLLDPELYYVESERTLPFITSYGCPYACAYCSEPTNSGRRWRGLAPERLVTEIHNLVRDYRPQIIDFMDPNFSSDPRRVVAFAEEMRKRPVKVGFMACMRARDIVMISKRMPIQNLADIGFERVFIGVESGSDRLLTHLDKAATTQDTFDACQALSDAGIQTWTSFMHDLPTETPEENEETLAMAERLIQLEGNLQSHHFYMPFPDTRLFKDEFSHIDLTLLRQEDWAESSTKGSVLWRGRPEFRNRVVDRLEKMRDERPDVFALTDLPERTSCDEPGSQAVLEPSLSRTYQSLIQEDLAG
ncbi:B12-binding domain-containing radical SAM protein [Streptomyces sp. Ag109_O5-1]|uniref:B12-binding domain-containing radical SAM protein n=1 Tax=Streptomyces sp. Ag109_O5-1 TaxID=1938851 RepID=UPI0021A7A487|nr:radical SAM protein [Streptomyces sp. Ag109_O5-1]